MGITYLGSGDASGNSVADGTRQIDWPDSLLADDFVVMYIAGNASGALMNNPAGWTQVVSAATSGGVSPSLYVGYRFAAGGETGSQTVTSGGNAITQGRMFAWRGVDKRNPLDVAAVLYSNGSSSNPYAITAGVTTTRKGCALFVGASNNSTTATGTSCSGPVTMTEVDDTAIRSAAAYTGIWTGVGDTGAVGVTWSSGLRGQAALLVLRPSGTPPLVSQRRAGRGLAIR